MSTLTKLPWFRNRGRPVRLLAPALVGSSPAQSDLQVFGHHADELSLHCNASP